MIQTVVTAVMTHLKQLEPKDNKAKWQISGTSSPSYSLDKKLCLWSLYSRWISSYKKTSDEKMQPNIPININNNYHQSLGPIDKFNIITNYLNSFTDVTQYCLIKIVQSNTQWSFGKMISISWVNVTLSLFEKSKFVGFLYHDAMWSKPPIDR